LGRGGGRASAAFPLLDDVTTSPASRRLASARPALAPERELILARTLRGGGPLESPKIPRFPARLAAWNKRAGVTVALPVENFRPDCSKQEIPRPKKDIM